MYRTNYQKKFSSFNPNPERRKGSVKWFEDELDAIQRLILPYLETHCFTCSTTRGLQVGHLFERRHRHVRWDTTVDGNCHLQCPRCNQLHEAKPAIYRNKFIDRFGPDAYRELDFRRRNKQKVELEELLVEKEAQLNQLQGKAA